MSSGCSLNSLDASSHSYFRMGYTFMCQQAAAVGPAYLMAIPKWLIQDRLHTLMQPQITYYEAEEYL